MVDHMDRRTPRRLASVASGAMAVCAFLAVSMAPAFAQVPEPGDLVEEVAGDVGAITDGAGDGVADAVEQVTGDVGDAVGGDAGQTTKDLGSSAGDIVRESTGTAGDLVGDTGSAVDDALDGLVGGSVQPLPNAGKPNVGNGDGRGRFETGSSISPRLPESGAPGFGTDLATVGGAQAAGSTSDDSIGTDDGVGSTILESLGGITFPLALVAIVAAFLAIQGRIDSADPKLSIAILDPEDETLSFQ